MKYVNFLLVGYTHVNIDALFGHWSLILRENDYLTIPLLINSFKNAELIPAITHLIEDISNFNSYIRHYIASREDILVGHSKSQQLHFYKHDDGWPFMQCKVLCLNSK